MRGICIQRMAVGVLIPLGSWAANRRVPDVPATQTLRVSVMVFDQAGVPDRLLSEAQQRAGTILGKAGVEMEWIDCHRPANASVCATVAELDRLFLTIVTEDDVRTYGEDVLGRSVPGDHGSHGVYARLFYKHVQLRADQER